MPPQQINSVPVQPQSPTSVSFWKRKVVWIPAALVVLFVVYVVGSHLYVISHPQLFANTVSIETADGYTTYTNHQFNFSIKYPDTLQATTSAQGRQPYSLSYGHAVPIVTIDNVDVNGTDGKVSIAASASKDDVKNCVTVAANTESGPPPITHKTINGVDFAYYEIFDPAAGQFESNTVYKTLQGNICIAINETLDGIETSHLQGAEADQNGADIKQVSDKLDSIVQTLQFIAAIHPVPSCTLSTDKQSYAVGDTITLSWTSQNATAALWEQPLTPNNPTTIVPPTGNPSVNGSAKTIANIQGNQTIALDVGGLGGIAACNTQVSVAPSNLHTTLTVDSVQETPNNTGKASYVDTLIAMKGTIKNPVLLNSSGLDIIFVDSAYSGPIEWNSLFWHVNVNNLDNHPQDVGAHGRVPIASSATTWSTSFYNVMPPGTYKYYIFPGAANGLSTSTALLGSGTFNSVAWSNESSVRIIYPRDGSDFFTENGGTKKIYWTVPQALVSSFPSDFNIFFTAYALKQGDTTNSQVLINDGNEFDFLVGSGVWDIDSDIKNGTLIPGTYKIVWYLSPVPKDPARRCARIVEGGCAYSAADSAIMSRSTQYQGETGWFVVDK